MVGFTRFRSSKGEIERGEDGKLRGKMRKKKNTH